MSPGEKFVPVIGLEVHIQLLTDSKIFSSDSTAFGAEANTQVNTVSLAHPGTLPKVNKKAVELAIKMGLACHSEISRVMHFDRKNYFYPDLPKGYQITQDKTPVCRGGYIIIRLKDGVERKIQLNRIHLEEDAGKSIHLDSGSESIIDFNRAGVPLIELVTEPVLQSPDEAYALLSEIRKLVRYLKICDGNMEEGSLRCDANVSVKPVSSIQLGTKVEIKNMNSIRYVQKAIDAEIKRQVGELMKGGSIISETRMFDVESVSTIGMRTKEELNDYRYFPDPDISPVEISEAWIETIRQSMPALPYELYNKFMSIYRLPAYDADVLTESIETAVYFEELAAHSKNYKAASNWMMGPVRSILNERGGSIEDFPVSPSRLAGLIQLIDEGNLSFSVASQRVLPVMIEQPKRTAFEVAQQLNVLQNSNEDDILPIIDQVLNAYPEKVVEYRKGKKGLLAMFMGEVMKRTKGKADPKLTNELLTRKLQKE